MKTGWKSLGRSACAAVLAAVALPGWADGRIINLDTLLAGAPHKGFVLAFQEGTQERNDPQVLRRTLAGAIADLRRAGGGLASAPIGLVHRRRMSVGADVVEPSRLLSVAEAAAVMRKLASLPGVDYVEPDLVLRPVLVPNDPLFGQQWGYTDADAGIRAVPAWDLATGAGVTVAVLDTGITAHTDLNANVVAGWDFISSAATANDGGGRDADPADPGDWTTGQCGLASNSSWHGTHVAGTVAAVSNNGNGVAGTAFNARVMPVRVLGVCGGAYSDIADAIIWSSGGVVSGVPTLAANAVARVINMSLGGSGACGAALQSAITSAISRGTTVVVAAGNDNADATGFQPANCAGTITVAAVDQGSNRAWFSNFGAKVTLAAPGVGIQSTLNAGTTTPTAENYASYSGTSMAAPHVAGVVALVQSRRLALGLPLHAPADIDVLLRQTATALTGACAEGCGAGIVNALAAVQNAVGNARKINEHADTSGKLTVAVFERVAAAAAARFTDFVVEVPADYVVIGGGVEGAEYPQGHLLTASYPRADLTAWLVSTKDHRLSNPAQIKAWAIGLKVAGLSAQQVREQVAVTSVASVSAAHPSATVAVTPGYTQIGGGFKVNWTGAGNLAWASYPSATTTWLAASKDHGQSSPATINVYSVGLRTSIAGVGIIEASTDSTLSAYAAHPTVAAYTAAGYALAGCGARVNWTGQGNLLWKIKPVNPGVEHGCEIGAKDHEFSSPATVNAFVVGIRVN